MYEKSSFRSFSYFITRVSADNRFHFFYHKTVPICRYPLTIHHWRCKYERVGELRANDLGPRAKRPFIYIYFLCQHNLLPFSQIYRCASLIRFDEKCVFLQVIQVIYLLFVSTLFFFWTSLWKMQFAARVLLTTMLFPCLRIMASSQIGSTASNFVLYAYIRWWDFYELQGSQIK